jgi:hypothetical protein
MFFLLSCYQCALCLCSPKEHPVAEGCLLLLNFIIENLIHSFGSVAGGRSVRHHSVPFWVMLHHAPIFNMPVLGRALHHQGSTVNNSNRTKNIKVALSTRFPEDWVRADGA